MNIQISRANSEDLDQIIELGAALHLEEKGYEPDLLFDREVSLAHYRAELSNPEALIIVARISDGTIAGYQYSYLRNLDYLSHHNKECVLEALFVDMRYRGQGIGRKLTQQAEEWAIKEKKVDRVATHIYSGNKSSIQLHISEGFEPYNIELVRYIQR